MPDRPARLLERAVEILEETGRTPRVDELARGLPVSPSTLRRRFTALGVPPKRFASVLRFRRAHAYLSTTPGATWADVVARFGNSDQAHLVRDYRPFSGASPTRWDAGHRGVDRRMGIEEPPEEPEPADPPPPTVP
jgi:transcriptional regulator GlxA family with amidase domain